MIITGCASRRSGSILQRANNRRLTFCTNGEWGTAPGGAVPFRPEIMRRLSAFALLPALLTPALPLVADQIPLQVSEPSYTFEIFDPTATVVHAFDFYNTGTDTVQVARIAVTPPLQVVKVLSKVPPGERG